MIGKDTERGTYYVQYKYKDAVTGKWCTTKKRGFKLKREAQEYELNLKSEPTEEDGENGSTSYTFKEMAEKWEDYLQCAEATREQHHTHFKIRFKRFYTKPIKVITKEDLLTWKTQLSKMNYSLRTKNMTLSFVRSVFKYAHDAYGIKDVASFSCTSFKKNREQKAEEKENASQGVWTAEQFKLFENCIDNELYKVFFHTLFWTGARRGEIIALQCSDLTDHCINIHGSLRRKNTGITPTKTGESRTVALDDDTYNMLLKMKEHFEGQYTEKGKYKSGEKSNFLFGGDEPLATQTISDYFNRAVKKSGLPRIRIHDLRHSHATILINNGVNIVAVSKRLGHADINITLKTYTHLLEKTNEQMMNTIQKIAKSE